MARAMNPWGLVLWGVVACGPVPDAPEGDVVPVTAHQALASDNGESLNGLAFNGLAFNGLAFNGLAFNGLNSAAFSGWYEQDPALADTVMKYVTACALAAGETRTYTDARGQTRVWAGGLGLAPDWGAGRPATVREQQLVSGCLAAHVNKFGRTVPISVQARDGRGQPVATTPGELSTFAQREGCFFGNLFTQSGVFVGHDAPPLRPHESSVRACALETGKDACEPIARVGACETLCTKDPSGTFYTQCTYKGVSYAPVTTRIRPQDIYSCGDGVCQFTERAGFGLDSRHCTLDCGLH
ncbi:hypothetical protein [Melittangium boletus]|uniref:hypothetical protein n=1 Tax=Melittangium boletus TaxID=83453 RepID=UPI003DA3B3AA